MIRAISTWLIALICCSGFLSGCERRTAKPKPRDDSFTVGIDGADKARQTKFGVEKCYVYQNYLVAISDFSSDNDNSQTIKILTKANLQDVDCDSAPTRSSSSVTYTGFFEGLYKNYAFIDSGTGPGGRALSIYDVSGNKKIYNAVYSDSSMKIENNIFTFSKDVQSNQKIDCPEALKKYATESALSIGYQQKTLVYLDSGREIPAGEIQCSVRQ